MTEVKTLREMKAQYKRACTNLVDSMLDSYNPRHSSKAQRAALDACTEKKKEVALLEREIGKKERESLWLTWFGVKR